VDANIEMLSDAADGNGRNDQLPTASGSVANHLCKRFAMIVRHMIAPKIRAATGHA